MNRFEIGKPPLRANVGHPPLEEPAKMKLPAASGRGIRKNIIKAAMQKTPGSSPIVYAD